VNFNFRLIVLVAAEFLCVAASGTELREFVNPYAAVDWEKATPYYANFHTHTTYSDGEFTPHEAIDAYHKLGVQILALTDHDNDHYRARPAILYPWTELSSIYEEIHEAPNPSWRRQNQRYGDISSPWQNRNPDALGMLSIPGTEISLTHHIGSLFCDFAGNTSSEQTALKEIGKRGGLAIFLHPGRYEMGPEWYIDFYRQHPHLIGLEIFNQNDRCPGDRDLWDRILHHLMPDRPVWGFAGDDMHTAEQLGWNAQIFLLPELTADTVRAALESGAFFLYRPRIQMALPSPPRLRIVASKKCLRLELEDRTKVVRWITYNPETERSEVIHQEAELAITNVPPSSVFVRASLANSDGTIYTQPFGIHTQPFRSAGSLHGNEVHK